MSEKRLKLRALPKNASDEQPTTNLHLDYPHELQLLMNEKVPLETELLFFIKVAAGEISYALYALEQRMAHLRRVGFWRPDISKLQAGAKDPKSTRRRPEEEK